MPARRRAPPGCGPQARWLRCSLLAYHSGYARRSRLAIGPGGRSKVQTLFIDRPLATISFNNLAATAAVRFAASMRGLNSTRSAPTISPFTAWIACRVSRTESPPGSRSETPGANAGSSASRSKEMYTGEESSRSAPRQSFICLISVSIGEHKGKSGGRSGDRPRHACECTDERGEIPLQA